MDCSLTFQGNDLTNPTQRSTSFSNSFVLPDTQAIRDLLAGAEQLDAGGPSPYQLLPAYLIDEGETTFTGVIEFISFANGWKVNLLDGFVSFFDAIEGKNLIDLNLSRFDHPWTLEYITSIAGDDPAKGVVYPLIDYGGIQQGVVPYDTICPAVYAKTLIGQICADVGYQPVGAWLTDPLLMQLALPFVGATPKAHTDDWVEKRTAKITVDNPANIVLKDGQPVNLILPLNTDSLPLDGYLQGNLKPF